MNRRGAAVHAETGHRQPGRIRGGYQRDIVFFCLKRNRNGDIARGIQHSIPVKMIGPGPAGVAFIERRIAYSNSGRTPRVAAVGNVHAVSTKIVQVRGILPAFGRIHPETCIPARRNVRNAAVHAYRGRG